MSQHEWTGDDNERAIPAVPAPRQPRSSLDTAIAIAREVLAEHSDLTGGDLYAYARASGATRGALLILLRALDAERGDEK